VTDELEDKYSRFFRYFNIDLQAEIAAGGSGDGLTNYYTKTESDAITNALDARIDVLEAGGGGSVDLSNYYTKTQVDTALSGKQAADSDLTAISGLSPVDNDVLQRKSGAWVNRTIAQLKTDLALAKGDVGLANVDNTSDATKNAAVATLTNKDLTSGTNTFPTFNQSTTGNAATATKLQTARTINGVSFDGTANITVADSTKVPTTRTVNGLALSANITLAKGDIGLGNVDNTSDVNKPISTATQAALDLKAALTVTDALNTRVTALEGASVATLTYSGTVTPDANTAKSFKLSMTGDATLAIPTNGSEGNRLFIAVTASGADRTLTLNGSYRLTTGTSATIVIPNSKTQYIGLRYNGTYWAVIASTQEL